MQDDSKLIKELVAQGKYIVASNSFNECGSDIFLEGTFDTRKEAMELFHSLNQKLENSINVWVEPLPDFTLPDVDVDIFLNDDSPF